MTHDITYRSNGVDIEIVIHPGPAEAAIIAAGQGLVTRKACSARVRDLAGSTAEICSLRPVGNGSYIRDDNARSG